MKRLSLMMGLLAWLPAVAVAQPRLVAHTELQELGQVEWKRPVPITFTITNEGTSDLVLTDVMPDCDCTSVNWTQTPIAPGQQGEVRLVYDASLQGRFNKSVAVYSNADPHLVYLRFTGQVTTHVTDYTRTHPHQIGEVRIDTTAIHFADVWAGAHPEFVLEVANVGEQPYEPVLMHLPQYVKAEAVPEVLQPFTRGQIRVTLLSDQVREYGQLNVPVYLSRFQGDKVGAENMLPLTAVLLPDFSLMTQEEKENAPAIRLSAEEVDLSELLISKKKVTQEIIVSNEGKSPLMIAKAQLLNAPLMGLSLKKNLLNPGESTKLKITVKRSDVTDGQNPLSVLLISNDWHQPKKVITIKVQ